MRSLRSNLIWEFNLLVACAPLTFVGTVTLGMF
jgi:hypothetical protein